MRRPPRSTLSSSSAASDVYKRQSQDSKISSYFLGKLSQPIAAPISPPTMQAFVSVSPPFNRTYLQISKQSFICNFKKINEQVHAFLIHPIQGDPGINSSLSTIFHHQQISSSIPSSFLIYQSIIQQVSAIFPPLLINNQIAQQQITAAYFTTGLG
eukprot:TRINITY_DN9361_c0_g1_i1.p2 TRINITY_DN9361_c0_g1~~TRINITY_DN9361_c0_g1_i1.p2  ORF type:complete len:156 (-),score=19.03 TRINITY_DN9361_c0_g1_i1:405-872(-)